MGTLDEFPDPTEVVPGYETDLRAVGTNRTVEPGREDEVDWTEVHPEFTAELRRTTGETS